MSAPTRHDLPEAPERIARLPVDPDRGYPVPWFVAWVDGKPDFRVIGEGRFVEAIRFERCWICGDRMGTFSAFVSGPMCAINRVSPEPPSHRDCAIYAATACPFLTKPGMHRREGGLPDAAAKPAGHMISRNPGVALVWVTKSWHTFRVPTGGFLIDIEDAAEALWFCEGRTATRAEVDASIASGLPILRDKAKPQGMRGTVKLDRAIAAMQQYLPA